ncbi:MAG: hypothetical protein RLZZ210_1402 [Pseudomonadota bacterium]|jgi:SAM-dependent MidA family methyltransferase
MQNNINIHNLIHNRIKQNGSISFSEFMEMALYTPYYGYYSQENINIGAKGDFTTACEISPLFGQTVANAITCDSILELGAGSGKLAGTIIKSINPKKYYILERSAFLRNQQQQYLASLNIHNVEWLDELPKSFKGSIIGNEVLDAIPVDVWQYDYLNNKWQARYIKLSKDEELEWVNIDINNKINIPQEILECGINDDDIYTYNNIKYVTESHCRTNFLLNSLANMHHSGQMIWIDYGFLTHEYFHPQRNMGTIMCYHQHKANTNPLINIGKQDISCHVNFSLVQDTLINKNYCIDYFDSQARFLIDYGILDLLNKQLRSDQYLSIAKQAQVLLSEAEMGALFKVLVCSKS